MYTGGRDPLPPPLHTMGVGEKLVEALNNAANKTPQRVRKPISSVGPHNGGATLFNVSAMYLLRANSGKWKGGRVQR